MENVVEDNVIPVPAEYVVLVSGVVTLPPKAIALPLIVMLELANIALVIPLALKFFAVLKELLLMQVLESDYWASKS